MSYRKVQSFTAKNSSTGKHIGVEVWQTFHDATSMAGTAYEEVGGMKELRTEDGEFLNHIEQGQYEDMEGTQYTSSDPLAP